MSSPSDRQGVLTAYAEMIPLYVDLNKCEQVAIELVVRGVSGGKIGNDLPEIIAIARRLRAGFEPEHPSRNQILCIVETVSQIGNGEEHV